MLDEYEMASNPYASPKRLAAQDAPKHSLLFDSCCLVSGGLSLLLGLASLGAARRLHQDDFDLFLLIFLGTSFLVWPVAVLAIAFSAWSISRNRRLLLPFVGIGLGCAGVALVVWAWNS